MLQNLHVKNLALMEETEIRFTGGVNILTGETGAGKSLLIGSINLALGGKFEREMLRNGAQQALVELTFSGNQKVSRKLEEMELEAQEDGSVLISRRMQVGKNVFRINGEVVTARQVKELAQALIDIHGQHEHQSLLHKRKHLEILDSFGGEESSALLERTESLFRECRELQKKLSEESLDERERAREQALAEFECNEIDEAHLTVGEDEELESRFRLMSNARRIMEGLSECYRYLGGNGESAGNLLSCALRALAPVSGYDKRLEELEIQLGEVDNLLNDFQRDVSSYMDDLTFDEEEFQETSQRLDLINRLKGKYGNTIEEILAYQQERQSYLDKLADYDAYIGELEAERQETYDKLRQVCEKLTALRVKNAEKLARLLTEALENLNFLTVNLEVSVEPLEEPGELGMDSVEFRISTNPGEPPRPLGAVASGGELSRIMLAIKTVQAAKDDIDSLIFDEIDAGISGRTAWQVSRQIGKVGREHQVICITHLPQIAAMADSHFLIEKHSEVNNTMTEVRRLTEEESTRELARLLGSDNLSEAALSNAQDMRRQAVEAKFG